MTKFKKHSSILIRPSWLLVAAGVSQAFLLASLTISARAQTDSIFEMGIKAYGSYHGGDIDVVNLKNLKVDLHAPLVSYPQRGKLHMGFTLRYSNPTAGIFCFVKNPKTGACEQYKWEWIPAQYGTGYGAGVQVVPDIAMGWTDQLYGTVAPEPIYTVISPDGSRHNLLYAYTAGETNDATGMSFNSANNLVVDADGVEYNLSNGTVEDPNGNEITTTPTEWLDSVDRAIEVFPVINFLNGTISGGTVTTDYSNCSGSLPTYGAALWTIPGPSGGTSTYKFCWAKFTATVGTTKGITTAYSGPAYMLQTLVLLTCPQISFT
jgi:hypothetical protein